MRKLIFTLLISLLSNSVFSQSALSYVRETVSNHLDSKLGDRYKGGLEISDVTESNGSMIVEGSFTYQIKTYLGNGNKVSRKFKARIKKILDDVSVQKLCYVFIEYGYSETPQKSCKCTDGNFVNYNDILYVD